MNPHFPSFVDGQSVSGRVLATLRVFKVIRLQPKEFAFGWLARDHVDLVVVDRHTRQ
jgi:hypothetical protein